MTARTMAERRLFQAIGLGFAEGEENAPSVTVKGDFELAEKIVAAARKFGIPVVEREDLCSALAEVPLDEPIPEELYEAAAAILRQVGALVIK